MNTNDTTENRDEGTQDGGTASTQSPPPPPALPRRLVRLTDGAPVAGVAAGLGAYFGIDPALVRLAFVVLAFAGGAGIVLYIACWIALPEGHPDDLVGAPPVHPEQATRWVGIGLIVLAVLLLATQLPFAGPPWGSGMLWAIGLIVLGVVLFQYDASRRERRTPHDDAGHPLPQPPVGPSTSASTGAGGGPPPPPPGDGLEPGPAAAPRRPEQPPSVLGRLAIGAGLLALGVVALLDNLDVLELDAVHYVAAALTVTGLGLVVGAWWGRARGLIGLGILLIGALVVTGVFGSWSPRGMEVGERRHRPVATAELADEYALFAGDLRLDLTALEAGGEPVRVRARVAMGELLVVVPDEANVTVQGTAAAGELRLLDVTVGGANLDHAVSEEMSAGAPTFDVDASTVFGRVRVVRLGQLGSSAGDLWLPSERTYP